MKNVVEYHSSGCRLLFTLKVLDHVAEFQADESTKATCLKGIKELCTRLSAAVKTTDQTLLETQSMWLFLKKMFFLSGH